jgi:hypothetical protein
MMRRHELDPVSLTFGAAFAGLGLLFLFGQADQALRLRWVWPLLLLALGLGILLDTIRSQRRTLDRDAGPPPEPALGRDADPDTDQSLEPTTDLAPYRTDPEPDETGPAPTPPRP